MSKIKVLIPTDFSVQAHFAWLMAQKLAEKLVNHLFKPIITFNIH
jgi:hypothetical protein